ncbi:MAG: uroporphyrinogen decarboxylase family protein [Kiritimatiellae bacterium]|nr:uroporphyrinogen decarboxylase family protein [Kiritimatiellia bacterium]
MNPRERYLETMLFGHPDRIPFHPGGPRQDTFNAWHGQGLPRDVDWFAYLCEQIEVQPEQEIHPTPPDVRFGMLPEFERKVLERKGSTIVAQDWKGNVCEIAAEHEDCYLGRMSDIGGFVTRRWIKCPVESWEDWERMKTRYDARDPARFPSDFAQRCALWRDRDRVVGIGFSGVFWQLREWMGFENLCMAFVEQPDLVRDMIAFWEAHVSTLLEKLFQGLAPDLVHISEDMAYKEKAMISPAMTREFILPTWRRWGELVHAGGCQIYDVDSDGHVGELIPLWIEAGFQVCDPLEVAAGNDLPAYRRKYGKRMAFQGGIDKRAMAKGGKTIAAEIERLRPVVETGGYCPSCDHGIPADVSWPCMVEYARHLARLTGWL